MSNAAKNRIIDTVGAITGGMNSGMNPKVLDKSQLQFAVNIATRGGFPHTRPPFDELPLTFVDGTTQTQFEDGRYQGSVIYDSGPDNPGDMFVHCGGHLFRISLSTFKVENVLAAAITAGTIPNTNNRFVDVVYFVQANEFLIIQDGINRALIWNGGGLRRAELESFEIPVGKAMGYHQGRIWLAQGRNFIAGDIVNGPTGLLKFTENDFLNEGGAFSVPIESGEITAITSAPAIDTASFQGDLLIHTANGIFSLSVPTDRDSWKNLQYPIQRVSIINYGSQGARSTSNVNTDTYFRASDGIRSFAITQVEFGSGGNSPISSEMNRILDRDITTYLKATSMVLFDNRLLTTVTPIPDELGIYFQGIAVMDFDFLSYGTSKSPPVWDGMWTKERFHELITGTRLGQEKCYAFYRDSNNKLKLTELLKEGNDDDKTRQIECFYESRGMGFSDGGNSSNFNLKKLSGGDIFVEELKGNVTFDLEMRPDSYPCWTAWDSFSFCAPVEDCQLDSGECFTIRNLQPGYRVNKKIKNQEFGCVLGQPDVRLDNFYTLQIKLKWTGVAQVNILKLWAEDRAEETTDSCLGSETCQEVECCPTDPYEYLNN